jgi:hypothetical protein
VLLNSTDLLSLSLSLLCSLSDIYYLTRRERRKEKKKYPFPRRKREPFRIFSRKTASLSLKTGGTLRGERHNERDKYGRRRRQ